MTMDKLSWFLDNEGLARLGQHVGITADQSRQVLQAGLPAIGELLSARESSPQGRAQLEEAAKAIPASSTLSEALSAPNAAADLHRAGEMLARDLMPGQDEALFSRLASQVGVDASAVRRLLLTVLPLWLRRSVLGETVVAAAPAATVTHTPPPPPPPVVTASPAAVVTAEPARRSGFPLWLLIPLLALLLGGCWLLNRPKTTTTTTTTTTTNANGQDIIVENPQTDAQLPPEAFTMSGKAPADMVLRIEDQGQEVASATADASGNWTAEIPAPTPGEHTYSIIGGDTAKSEFKVNIVDGANGTGTTGTEGDTSAAATGTDGTETGTGDTTGTDAAGTGDAAAATGAAAAAVAITEPASGSEVPAAGFNLKGTGAKAGETYQIYEDGVSVGTFTADDAGAWTVDVAGPTAGDHTYSILDTAGNRLGEVPLKVVSAQAGAACTQDFTLSLQDGESVSAPFRFGGQGNAKAYVVTVYRGEREIGRQTVPLSGDCTWSYVSRPGGQAGAQSQIRYAVRPSDDQAGTPLADITLNVTGSGVNFNEQGEYTGPTN